MAGASPNQEGSSAVSANGPINSAPPIRTMKDDLASSLSAPPPLASSPNNQPLDISASPTLPSSPLAAEQSLLPAAPRKKHTGIVIAFLILLLAAIGGAGAWYYLSYSNEAIMPAVSITPTPTTITALEVIPSNATVVLHYNLTQTTFRERISRAWQSQPSDTPVTSLLAGNPSHVLLQADVSEMYYVSLQNDPRPYLILPKSPTVEQIVSQQREEQVKEINGWYVLHPLTVASYTSALEQGNIMEKVQSTALGSDFPLHLVISSQFLSQLHPHFSILYPSLPVGQYHTLNAQISATGAIALVTNDNLLVGTEEDSSALNISNNLYALVPNDADFIWQGQDLSQDVSILTASRGLVVDTNILQKLPVDTFIKRLNSSYVYYERLGADSVKDFGLVIQLPENLRSNPEALQLGDENLEAALQGLIPRITGQPAPSTLAFNDGIYADINIKFINLVSTTQAIDYALHGDNLLIATSKEGIVSLIETITGNSSTIKEESSWTSLLAEHVRTPQGRLQIFTSISDPLFTKLLPRGTDSLPLIIQSDSLEASTPQLDATIGWTNLSASPAASSTASPTTSLSPSPSL